MTKSIVLIFGRFQPPTIGHELLFKTAVRRAAARGAKVAVFVSQTQDRKNPLSHRDRTSVIRDSVPGLLIGPTSVRTPAEALTWAFEQGYRDLTLLVGDDRMEGFERMAGSWQNAEDPQQTAVVRVEALPRTGAMDASKVSGTVARQYAQRGDLANFKKILISGAQNDRVAKQFMKSIQAQLGILEEVFMSDSKTRSNQETFEESINRIVAEILDENYQESLLSVKSPDNPGEIVAGERVPEDVPTNKSVVVLYPDRKLKYDMKEKAQKKKAEEQAAKLMKP